jgi:hypothetical protein
VFDAARHTLDHNFITTNHDYKHLVKMIDTGSHQWLKFTMGQEDKVHLFARGAKAAAEFLCAFIGLSIRRSGKGLSKRLKQADQSDERRVSEVERYAIRETKMFNFEHSSGYW